MAANIYDCIMLIGDSMTERSWEDEGLAQKLAVAYQRKLDVINRGMIGFNSEWLNPVFEQSLATREQQPHLPKVQLLTIWVGANDATYPESAFHIPIEKYKANLTSMIQAVKSPSSPRYAPHTRIVLITPTPVDGERWLKTWRQWEPNGVQDRDWQSTKVYAEAAKKVGKKEGVPVLDLWTRFWEAAGEKVEGLRRYQFDGVHFTKEGYEVVFDELIKLIKDKYPEIHPDNLQPAFVQFSEIDPKNPLPQLQKRDIFGAQK